MSAPESPASKEASPQRQAPVAGNSWAWPITWMASLLIVAGAGLYCFHACTRVPSETLEGTGELVKQIAQEVQQVASAFKQGTITTTFTSYATTISGSQYFQFATLSQREVFTRTDESSVAFGYIPLPDVIVEASAPVTYTYYLDLRDRWDFLLKDGIIYVTAPKIKYNKPSVDVSKITYEVKKNSLIRNTSEALDNLKSSITWLSFKKAQNNIDLVRETGRRQTEAFVRNWLAKSFTDGKNYPVKVRFRNEAGAQEHLAPEGKE